MESNYTCDTFSIFQKDEVVQTESKPIIDGVINPETTQEQPANETNTTVVITYPKNEEVQEEPTTTEESIPENETTENENTEATKTEETVENSNEEEKTTFKFSDFTILF